MRTAKSFGHRLDSFILQLRPTFRLSLLVDFLHYGVHLRVVRPTACRAANAFAPFACRRNHLDLDLDFLALGDAGVFVEFAVDLAV